MPRYIFLRLTLDVTKLTLQIYFYFVSEVTPGVVVCQK